MTMKKYFIMLVLITIGTPSYCQWILQNPYPTTSNLEKVTCINTNTALFFGGDATILRTSNSGASFVKIMTGLGLDNYLTSCDFPTSELGFAVSYNGTVLKTMDAGLSWIVACDTIQQASMINCIKFADSLNGYMAGGDSQVFRTTDGGYSWHLQTSSYPCIFHDLYLVTADTLFAAVMDNGHIVFGGSIWKSHDTGKTWTECYHDYSHRSINAIKFLNSGIGYAIGGDGLILKAVFNGMAWDPLPNPAGMNKALIDIKLIDSQTICIVGAEGVVMKSTDAGQSWIMDSITPYQLRSLDITNNLGYAVGIEGKVFQTTDNGSTWIALSKGSTDDLNSVFFVNESVGYAAGGVYSPMKGTILKTTDGGEHWIDLDCGISEDLFSIYFTDINTGFAAGTRGLIAKTTDGGLSWTTSHSNVLDEFHSVSFSDNNTGYAVGLNILKTTNGGIDWYDISPGLDCNLRSIVFFDSNTGFVVGFDYSVFSDVILKTTDGGQTWSSYHFSTQNGLTGIHFSDYYNGFAVGTGVAYKTSDGGESWNQVLDVGNLELYAVFMTSSNTGFIAANYGKIFYTSDGGNSWAEKSPGTLNPLKSIFFTGLETGFTVGLNGNIFKTTNGGINAIDIAVVKSNFSLFPNPAATRVTLESTYKISGKTNVVIFNSQGKQVLNQTFDARNFCELDICNLSTGIYIIKILTNNGVETKKLIVQ